MNTASVLLPVYNAQRVLDAAVAETLEILSQSTERFELMILDDGSTDETAEVARDLAARYPQIRVIRHPVRLGLSEAIQTGFDRMPDDVIVAIVDRGDWQDDDDLYTLERLERAERRAVGRSRFRNSPVEFHAISREAFERIRTGQPDEIAPGADAAHGAALAMARRLKNKNYLKAATAFWRNN